MSHQDNLRHEPIVQPPPESTVVPVSSASSASVASSQEKLSGSTKKIVTGAVALAAASVLGVLLLRKRKTPGKSNRTALPLAVSNKSATKARLRARVPVSAVSVAAQPAARSRPRLQKENDDASTLLHDLVPVLSSALSLASSWRAKRKQDDKRAGEVAALAAAMQAEAEVSAPVREDKRLDPDVVKIVPGNRWQIAWQLSRGAVNAWLDDFAPSMGAAIAYYTAFSIAPILIIAIAIAGMIFGKDAAQGEIVWQIRSIVGEEGAIAVQGLLRSVSVSSDGAIATTLSIITLVIGSTAVFAELQNALDRIWRTPAVARVNGIWALIRTRLLSFGLILGLGFMLMVSLVVSAGLAALGKWWGGWIEGWEVFMQVLNLLISFGVFTALFSAIYKFMPRADLSWHDVRIGAMSTTILFLIGKSLIGLYLGRTGMSSGFGAAGSFALLLAWIYYSAQIFLLGAEFTWIYANNFGSRVKHRTRMEAQEA